MTVRTARVSVYLDGDPFTLWTEISIHRSVESLAGGFQLSLAAFQRGLAEPGREVEIFIDEQLLISGFSERVSGGKSGSSHDRKLEGRDKSADLIDASARVPSFELSNVTLEDIVSQVASKFGIFAEFDPAGTGDRFEKFSIQPGESAWSAIERACRLRGMLAYTSSTGLIQIRRGAAGEVDYELADGRNISDWSYTADHSARFASYVVRGTAPGNDDKFAVASAQIEGAAFDEGIDRYRPLEIVAEGNVSKATAEIRAQWEATVRAARAEQVQINVPGWRPGQWLDGDPEGNPWQINTLVPVHIPEVGIRGKMLLVDLTLKHSGSAGTTAALSLVRPDAYQPEPVVEESDTFSDRQDEVADEIEQSQLEELDQ